LASMPVFSSSAMRAAVVPSAFFKASQESGA
jgi:hypothetical protein